MRTCSDNKLVVVTECTYIRVKLNTVDQGTLECPAVGATASINTTGKGQTTAI